MNHPDPYLLDRYALGQLTDAGQLVCIEEHLLACEYCRQQVTRAEDIRNGPLKMVPAR
jgi:hypothetical protein